MASEFFIKKAMADNQHFQEQFALFDADLKKYPSHHKETVTHKGLTLFIERMSWSNWHNWRGCVVYKPEWLEPREEESYATIEEKESAMLEALEGIVRIDFDYLGITLPGDSTRSSCIGVDTLKNDDAECCIKPEAMFRLPTETSTYKNFEWMREYLTRIADAMLPFLHIQ